MEVWQAIVLGLCQGFTEFLPVSSSGHLMLLQNWFNVKENALFYTVTLHIGTLIPVLIVLRKRIAGLFKNKLYGLKLLVLATIPAGIFGILFEKIIGIEQLFEQNIWLLSLTFLFTAVELLFSERRAKKVSLDKGLNFKTAFIMGVGQAVGVLPGISRSGSTLTFGTLSKIKGQDNAEFTFLMSIPIILSAVLLSTVDLFKAGSVLTVNFTALFFGIIASATSGYIAVNFMLNVIKKANYKWFYVYLILISVVNLVVFFV